MPDQTRDCVVLSVFFQCWVLEQDTLPSLPSTGNFNPGKYPKMNDKLLTGTYQKHQLNKKIIISGGHIVIVDQVLIG